MSNDCGGVLKVVSKNKETLERIKNILEYEDSEYCLYRCKYAHPMGDIYDENGFWMQYFNVCGAWSCDNFFHYGDNEDKKIVVGYEIGENGKEDYDKPKYGTAHFTDLCHLTQVLDFGCELFASESGCCFCSHHLTNHNGEMVLDEVGDYELIYPEDENGEPNYDADPEEKFGIDDYMEFSSAEEIYGILI
jgi:hypothetical protein